MKKKKWYNKKTKEFEEVSLDDRDIILFDILERIEAVLKGLK